MKTTITIFGLVCAMSLLISCSSDDFQENNQENAVSTTTIIYDGEGNPINPKDKG